MLKKIVRAVMGSKIVDVKLVTSDARNGMCRFWALKRPPGTNIASDLFFFSKSNYFNVVIP